MFTVQRGGVVFFIVAAVVPFGGGKAAKQNRENYKTDKYSRCFF